MTPAGSSREGKIAATSRDDRIWMLVGIGLLMLRNVFGLAVFGVVFALPVHAAKKTPAQPPQADPTTAPAPEAESDASGEGEVALRRRPRIGRNAEGLIEPSAQIAMRLRRACPDADPTSRIGAVAFIHRFGALLNPHVHFHCVVVDGVFEADGADGVRFHEARGIGPETIAEIQAHVRHRVLSVLARRGVLEREDAEAMGTWDRGGGFSLDASVRVEASDRQGLERLLRYCARPAFALERLREIDAERLVYESVKPGAGGSVRLMLTPLELIERLAALDSATAPAGC